MFKLVASDLITANYSEGESNLPQLDISSFLIAFFNTFDILHNKVSWK